MPETVSTDVQRKKEDRGAHAWASARLRKNQEGGMAVNIMIQSKFLHVHQATDNSTHSRQWSCFCKNACILIAFGRTLCMLKRISISLGPCILYLTNCHGMHLDQIQIHSGKMYLRTVLKCALMKHDQWLWCGYPKKVYGSKLPFLEIIWNAIDLFV